MIRALASLAQRRDHKINVCDVQRDRYALDEAKSEKERRRHSTASYMD
jgi:hypothetical protein